MIGVFDSGFGGLTVLDAFIKELPSYDYVYLGDNARAPYGNHCKEIITKFTREGVEFLFEKGARLVILACNTASSNALRELQHEMIVKPGVKDKNILGVVIPIAEKVAEMNVKKIALIATKATVESGVYEAEFSKRMKNFDLMEKACPLLVPLIEEGWAHKMETKRVLKSYLRDMKSRNPDVLVPACTHYPILQKDMKLIMGKGTEVLNAPEIVANSLKDYLDRHPEIESLLGKKGKCKFFTTDSPERFVDVGKSFFAHPIDEASCAIL